MTRGARFRAFGIAFAGTIIAAAGSAWAAQPKPWAFGMQNAASPVADDMHFFHNDILLPVITAITIFVMALLAYVCVKFRRSKHPTPSRTTHNTVVEVLWTVTPVIILVLIAIPSFKLLYKTDAAPNGQYDMTLKVVGNQWYWTYVYPDQGNFTFDANLLDGDELPPGAPRLLMVDNRVVLPVDTNIRLQFTSSDVLHSWTVPAFGVKVDTVPGRLNESWVRAEKTGVYYGQCSELCGVRHAYMPIAVEIVSKDEFQRWVTKAQAEYASVGTPTTVDTPKTSVASTADIASGTQVASVAK